MENGILTRNEKIRLESLLLKSQKYAFVNLPFLLDGEVKFFNSTGDHLLNIYLNRYKNTNKIKVRTQLSWLVNNLTLSINKTFRVSICGPEGDRIIIISDVEMNELLGIISMEDSISVLDLQRSSPSSGSA